MLIYLICILKRVSSTVCINKTHTVCWGVVFVVLGKFWYCEGERRREDKEEGELEGEK